MTTPTAGKATDATERIPGARVLIVDDDPLMRGMAARTLRHAGFAVSEVDGGAEALAAFERRSFELILLDVMMPDMDGYEVCAHIRRSPQGASIPILMLTGLNDTESIELAYRAGATDFISKPINWTLLSHRVRYSQRAGLATELALRSRERLERAQRIASLGSWEIALDGGRMTSSPELSRILGMPEQPEAALSVAAFLAQVSDTDRAMVQAMRARAESDGTAYQITFRILRHDGAVRTVHEQAHAVVDGSGRQIAVEGITQDITARVEAEKRINQLARYDALTGLPNREFFDKLAKPSLERSRRLGSTCALLHLDIDRFKAVNDAMGRAHGDAVLVAMAERIQASVRASDLGFSGRMASESVLGRAGANAFTLLLVDAGDDQQVGIVAERLLQAVAQPIRLEGTERDLVLTTSIGIALFPRDASDAGALARCAEQAVYDAKASGRAQHLFFDSTMNQRASARLEHESDLRRAIAGGELRLHYQPKVDPGSGAVVGAEALVRWQHPLQGLVPPAEFVGLAEESGLILALTDWVLETVCTDLVRWRDAAWPLIPVSVNLASTCFADAQLPTQLAALLQRHQLPAGLLVLEITESLLMADVDRVVQRLGELRSMGFRVSLDDFGTGFSSLRYLQTFPIDELKVDRAFVTDAWRGGRDSAIAASIIALGRAFDLTVVAEGVETREQARHLLSLGCSVQQGYLFARPQATTAFEAILVQGRVDTTLT